MKDAFTRSWIIENAQTVLGTYSEGITLRQLYYRLVALGMTNDLQQMCRDAIRKYFDRSLHAELEEREEKERKKYQAELKKFVNKLKG